MCVAVENWSRGGRARTGARARPRAHHRCHHHWRTPTPGRPRAPREPTCAKGEPMGRSSRGGRRCAVSVRPAWTVSSVLAVRGSTIGVIHPSDGGRPTRQASRDIETRCGDTGPDEGGNGESSGVGPRISVVRASISAWAGASDMLSPSPSTGSCCATSPSANATSTVVATPIVGSSGPASGWTAWATSTETEACTCTRFVCSTGPSLPGLLILIETLMFTGRYWTASP